MNLLWQQRYNRQDRGKMLQIRDKQSAPTNAQNMLQPYLVLQNKGENFWQVAMLDDEGTREVSLGLSHGLYCFYWIKPRAPPEHLTLYSNIPRLASITAVIKPNAAERGLAYCCLADSLHFTLDFQFVTTCESLLLDSIPNTRCLIYQSMHRGSS